ncbi:MULTISPECIES: hypothetical protein [unclassified Pseudomonas]|uniref:hypothetical protein n=1 Tax=unclassified Pseudomonas TaxID=196821 RepID=UPI000A1F9F68|nr:MULTISPECIES: hypothetical protein [unclassified Pseudomonas]
MLSTNFYGFIDFFMGGEIELQPKDVGLNSFSESEFFENNYELIGESSDFHFFEKAHDVPYFNRKAIILLKYYFNGDERLGGGTIRDRRGAVNFISEEIDNFLG